MLIGWEVMMLLGMVVLYFIPTIVAMARNHHRALGIFLANFFLGWTVLGWLVALAFAVSREHEVRAAEAHDSPA